MLPKCLLLTVPTAGTPVQLTTDQSIVCVSLLIKALPSNAGPTVYVGRAANFNATSGADLIADINGADQSFLVQASDNTNRIVPAQYWVDAVNSGDKLLVTYWVG
jgi:hypothetical protein